MLLVVDGVRECVGETDGETEVLGVLEGEWEMEGVTEGVTEMEGVTEGVTEMVVVMDGEREMLGVTDGVCDTLGEGDADGEGRRDSSSLHNLTWRCEISSQCRPVAVASRMTDPVTTRSSEAAAPSHGSQYH